MTSNELEIFKQSILDEVRVMMQTTGQVTQYIGARYVPLFADPLDWNSQMEYEPLTIVLNQGNSFTSRQFVPKGIDISNTDFWANTGNYNAQIEQYRKEVEQYRQEVVKYAESVTKLSDRLNDLHLLDVKNGDEISGKLEEAINNHAGVIIPSGNYTLNRGITISASSKYINLGGSTITCDGNFISFEGQAGEYNNRVIGIHIENGNIRNKDSENRTDYSAISFTNYGVSFVNNVNIGYFGKAISLNGGSEMFIHDINIQGNGTGVYIDAKDVDASGIYVTNGTIANNGTSIDIVGGRGVYIDNCVFAGETVKSIKIDDSELVVVKKSEFETLHADAIYATASTAISVENCLFVDTSGTRKYIPITALNGTLSVMNCHFSDFTNCIYVTSPLYLSNLLQVDSYVYNHIKFDSFIPDKINYMTLCNPDNAMVKDGSMFFCEYSNFPTTGITGGVITHFSNPNGYCEVKSDLIYIIADSQPDNSAHYVCDIEVDGNSLKVYSYNTSRFALNSSAKIYGIYLFNRTYRKLPVFTQLPNSVNVAPVNDIYYSKTAKKLGYFVNNETYEFKTLA